MKAGIGTSHALRYLALAVSWLVLWRVSALMEYAPHASIWFPPAGLTFAALLLLGWRALPVLMGCAILVTFWVDRMYGGNATWQELMLSGLVFGTVHCGAYGLGAWTLKRVIKGSGATSVPAIIILFLVIGCLSALCAALAGIQALEWTGLLGRTGGTGLWLPWWIGDMAGALVLTPLFLGLLSWRYPQIGPWMGGLTFQPQPRDRPDYLLKLLVTLSLLSAVMLLSTQVKLHEAALAIFILIIPQMWIVYTESPFRSALSLAILSTAAAVWVAALGLKAQALTFEFALCVIAASAYFGFAVPALIASNRQLRELAFRDGLTKVATKGHFFDRADQVLDEARRESRSVSLMVIDIDRFKQINDQFGHAVGDLALVTMTRTVRSHLRDTDLMGRFGGDEFIVLLPDTGLAVALELADRLQLTLQETCIPGTEQVLPATFGVAEIQPSESLMQAFQRADRALLQVKRGVREALEHD